MQRAPDRLAGSAIVATAFRGHRGEFTSRHPDLERSLLVRLQTILVEEVDDRVVCDRELLVRRRSEIVGRRGHRRIAYRQLLLDSRIQYRPSNGNGIGDSSRPIVSASDRRPRG